MNDNTLREIQASAGRGWLRVCGWRQRPRAGRRVGWPIEESVVGPALAVRLGLAPYPPGWHCARCALLRRFLETAAGHSAALDCGYAPGIDNE